MEDHRQVNGLPPNNADHAQSFNHWWPIAIAAVFILPLLPSLAVIAVGFLLPGIIPWSIANIAIVAGAALSFAVCVLLLRYRRWPNALRGLALAIVALVMVVFSRFEFFTTQECVTQQGKYIDIQRQFREIQAAQEKSCDDQL